MANGEVTEVNGWFTVVAFDPGGTTGWCVMSVEPRHLLGTKPVHKKLAHFACGQIAGGENSQADEMYDLLDLWDDSAWLCEDFIVRKFLRHREFLSPVRITARIEYRMSHAYPFRPMFKQQPALAMSAVTDDRQKEWGLWSIGQPHARDATKHALTFLMRARESARMRLAAWPLLCKVNGDIAKSAPDPHKSHLRDVLVKDADEAELVALERERLAWV
jgi:hypothetical protein